MTSPIPIWPKAAPPVPRDEAHKEGSAFLLKVLHALIPPVALIIAVLGSILAGVATPTEAAAVGAVVATLLVGIRVQEMQLQDHVGDNMLASNGSLIGRPFITATKKPRGCDSRSFRRANCFEGEISIGSDIVRHDAWWPEWRPLPTVYAKVSIRIIQGASITASRDAMAFSVLTTSASSDSWSVITTDTGSPGARPRCRTDSMETSWSRKMAAISAKTPGLSTTVNRTQ